MLKKQALKHNVIDREKILVPPSWDSWGKIRVIREGFDVEGTSSKWGIDISNSSSVIQIEGLQTDIQSDAPDFKAPQSPVVHLYESAISDPHSVQKASARKKPGIEVSVPNMQDFLASQQETLARLAAEDEKSASSTSTSSTFSTNTGNTSMNTHDRMADQIGPVQVNMGGIQVDADDILKKLRNQSRTDPASTRSKEDSESTPKRKGEGAYMSTPEMNTQNDALRSFFTNLKQRGVSNSPKGTPSKTAPQDSTK